MARKSECIKKIVSLSFHQTFFIILLQHKHLYSITRFL